MSNQQRKQEQKKHFKTLSGTQLGRLVRKYKKQLKDAENEAESLRRIIYEYEHEYNLRINAILGENWEDKISEGW